MGMGNTLERVVSNWRFSKKFGFLGLIAFSTTGLLTYNKVSGDLEQIQFVKQEIQGSAYMQPLEKALLAAQQHRGLSSSLLTANNTLPEQQMAEKREQFKHALSALSDLAKQHNHSLATQQQIDQINTEWSSILSSLNQDTPAERFKRHSALLGKLLALGDDIAANSGLALDPEMVSYYLIDSVWMKGLPLMENLGKARHTGTTILRNDQANPQDQFDLISNFGAAMSHINAIEVNIGRVASANPAFTQRIASKLDTLKTDLNKAQQAIIAHVLPSGHPELAHPPMRAEDYFNLITQITNDNASLIDACHEEYDRVLNAREDTLQKQMWTTLFETLATALLFFGFTWVMYRSIQGTIHTLQEASSEYAKGDFHRKIETQGKDELASLATSFNHVSYSLRTLIDNVTHQTKTVADSAEQLFSATSHLNSAVNKQNEATSSAAASIEEMAATVNNISSCSNDALEISKQSGLKAKEGENAVTSAANEMTLIAQSTQEVANMISSLNTRFTDISGILSAIQDISGQTNLLALNAAIEAARAGENGRGFAVVADEVRTLAERTAGSTVEISQVLSQIEGDLTTISAKVSNWKHEADQGVNTAIKAAAEIQQLGKDSTRVMEEVLGIGHVIEEHALASDHITQDIAQIARMSEDNAEIARQLSGAAHTLRQTSRSLLNGMSKFRTS